MAGPGDRRPMVGHEKPDNLFKTYASIIKDMKKEWGWLIFIIVLLTVSSIFNCLVPIKMGEITNSMPLGDTSIDKSPYYTIVDSIITLNWGKIIFDFALVGAFYLIIIVCTWLAEWIVVRVSADFAYETRKKIKVLA